MRIWASHPRDCKGMPRVVGRDLYYRLKVCSRAGSWPAAEALKRVFEWSKGSRYTFELRDKDD